MTEQLLQFFWRSSSTAVGVCAVLCIAILTGVIYSNGKLPIAWIYFVFYGNYLLPLRFSSFYLLPPGKNGYKKPTAYNALHVRWLLQPYFCFSVGSHLEDCIIWSQIPISIHIPHLQHCFSFMFLSPISTSAFLARHTYPPVFPEKGRLPLSFCCPRLVRGKTRSSILACGRAMPMSGILFVLLCGFADALADQCLFAVIQFPAKPFDHGHLRDPDGLGDFPLPNIGDPHLIPQIFVAHFLHLPLDTPTLGVI